MPIFTQTISNQNTSYSAGVKAYPGLGAAQQYTTISDEFKRETLTPTGAYQLYTNTIASTGTVNIQNQNNLRLATAVTLNDYCSSRNSGQYFSRASQYIDPRSQIQYDVIFATDTATVQFWIGLIANSGSGLTALPTTAKHMGVYVDTSVSANYKLTSGNGTTQVTTDSGTAATGGLYRLNIIWNGDDSGTINLYSSTNNYSTLVKSQTVTSLNMSSLAFQQQWFIQSLSGAVSRAMNCYEWRIMVT